MVSLALPTDYFDRPLISSFVEKDRRGNLHRVEIRGDSKGLKVRASFPLPSTLGGPRTARGFHQYMA